MLQGSYNFYFRYVSLEYLTITHLSVDLTSDHKMRLSNEHNDKAKPITTDIMHCIAQCVMRKCIPGFKDGSRGMRGWGPVWGPQV